MCVYRSLLIVFVAAWSVPVYANWGSTAGGSVATGNFRAYGTEQVEMRREDLHIKLYRDRAKVEIDYVLRNTGPAVDVRAGFPSLGVQLEGEKHQEIEAYTISADGHPVAFITESGDPSPFKNLYDAKFREMGELDEYPADKRPELLEWLVSTVHFNAGQSRHIHIRYESLYAYCGGGYSDDSDDCDDRFAYVLSTAATWKGPIIEGHVTIEAMTVPAVRLILSPAGRFRREGFAYHWDFRNLKPSRSDDILVNLNDHSSTIAEYGSGQDPDSQQIGYYTLEGGRYSYVSRNYVPHAGAGSAESSLAVVLGEDPGTAWHTPHAPGAGDALVLDMSRTMHIDQIGVIAGCSSDAVEWRKHARIREVEVSVNGVYTRKSILPDEFTFPWPESQKAYQWIDLPPYAGGAKTIRLVILSVYPGSADQITCIGKVRLRKWLSSRPQAKSGVDGHELP
jgi:hypothetical protein